jgi:serine/threonine-protein kinase
MDGAELEERAHVTVEEHEVDLSELPARGTRLADRYELEACIGLGGMGGVYRAWDTALERRVAVKVLRRSLAGSEAVVERFLLEARLLSSFDHPNLVPVYDVGRQDGNLFFVMKLLEGRTLADVRSPMRPLAALDAATHVLAGLEYVHARGLVHRDIKPENLFVETSGRVVILDFGIGHAVAEGGRGTAKGFVVGTPGYISPEALAGAPCDARSDLFGLAVVLFELLTGFAPFPRMPTGQPLVPLRRSAPRLRRHVRGAHATVEALVARGLAIDPNRRFSSAVEMRRAVKNSIEWVRAEARQIEARETRDSIPVTRRGGLSRMVWVASASFVLVAGCLVAFSSSFPARTLRAEVAPFAVAAEAAEGPVPPPLPAVGERASRPRKAVRPRRSDARPPEIASPAPAPTPAPDPTPGVGAHCVLPGSPAAAAATLSLDDSLREERLRALIKESVP